MSYVCEDCGKEFKYSCLLINHKNRKLPCIKEPKIYNCKYCNCSFKHRQSLYKHTRVNCKLKPLDTTDDKDDTDSSPLQTQSTKNITDDLLMKLNIFNDKFDSEIFVDVKEYFPNLIYPFGYENITSLVENSSKISKIFNKEPIIVYGKLFNYIYSNDDNRNFTIQNINTRAIMYINTNLCVMKATSNEDFYEKMNNNISKVIDFFLNKFKDDIDDKWYVIYQKFINNINKQIYLARIDTFIAEEYYYDTAKFKDMDTITKMSYVLDYRKETFDIIETYIENNYKQNTLSIDKHREYLPKLQKYIFAL